MSEGIIYSINGPIVKAKGMEKSAMLDLVEVGNDMLIGEIISFEGENATIQVYEDNSGMKPGEKVKSRNMPISIALGPGLLGTIYDGIQRPLVRLEELSGSFMKRGEKVTPLRSDIKWKIDSLKKAGDNVIAGAVLFEFEETDLIKHRIMVPPGINGKLTWIAEPGEYSINDEVYRITDEVEGEYKGTLYHYWPARNPRPVKERVLVEKPLLTGQRIIDTFYPIAKGGSCAIPGGFGTGKTMTQHALAKWSDADIIVYIGCGERGNEMTDVLNEFPKLIDPETGKSLMDRTVLIANTSNMPVAAREASVYTGITIAE
ncbi:MAG: V-type ATP synthase subunit A, partial [Spirochaetes bacterium]|nr:V-type ATP synthase subunit A [Spirochaetota bacterium]